MVNFEELFLEYGIEISFLKNKGIWQGNVNLDPKYTGYFYFEIVGDNISFHTHKYEETKHYLLEHFGIQTKKEGEQKLKELNGYLQKAIDSHSVGLFGDLMIFYVKKLKELKKQNDINLIINKDNEECKENLYSCLFNVEEFPYLFNFIWFDKMKAIGSEVYKDARMNKIPGLRFIQLSNVEDFLGEEFLEKIWQQLKKQSKERLRLLHLI